MSGRVVEINAESVRGLRTDVAATRGGLQDHLAPLRGRAGALGVGTRPFDDLLGVADELTTDVLPVLEHHLALAEDLNRRSYGGRFGDTIPLLDPAAAPGPVAAAPVQPVLSEDGTLSVWSATTPREVAHDEAVTSSARSLGHAIADWFDDTVEDVGDAVGRVRDRWDGWTGDVGDWLDEHATGVKTFLGEHADSLRSAGDVISTAGWITTAAGGVVALAGAVVGGIGGGIAGAAAGGVGAIPGALAGATVGAEPGMLLAGAGMTVVSLGDLLHVAADWGDGTTTGQQMVSRAAGGVVLTALSLGTFKIVGKLGPTVFRHLPPGTATAVEGFLDRLTATGYGQPRLAHADRLADDARPPAAANPAIPGADAEHWMGVNPETGKAFTSEEEWAKHYTYADGTPRYPPNRGAVPGSLRTFYDADLFTATHGRHLDRIGEETGTFLGVPPGTPWPQRAMAPGNVGDALHRYDLTDRPLPAGMKIEVATIAPGFGQPGGGTQVQFIQEVNGEFASVWSMEDLVDLGVLTRVSKQ
ncbi:TNT domain-containing protein [Kineococcus sp. SYSU DK001]|uniref:TNT domain-containing protein n=1 Tax=Kineococcus sp. SYSU DK001 TaxID=3383122 RepID=UPI003D7D8B3B